MTKLIVTPIDTAARGSYRQRKNLMVVAQRLAAASANDDGAAAFDAYLELEDLAVPRLKTDDGTPVEDALDQLSADDFDLLVEALLESPVPTKSADPSETTDSDSGA